MEKRLRRFSQRIGLNCNLPQLTPSPKAKREIITAAEMLGGSCTWHKLKQLTGYPTPLLMIALKGSLFRPKRKMPSKVVKNVEATPVWIDEVKAHTGLDCIKVKRYRAIEEWLLISPTGVPVLKLIGSDTILQSIQHLKNPAGVLQGLTSSEVAERRAAKRRKHKAAE